MNVVYASDYLAACQACEKVGRLIRVDEDDPSEPYLLCQDCSQRLFLRALQPLEWFNLASKHGCQKYLIHDGFYDQDGTACQPEAQLDPNDCLMAPSLNDVTSSVERLLGYCFTRWSLGPAEFEALAALNSEDLLAAISRPDATSNPAKLSTVFTICANILGQYASDWVHGQFERAMEQDVLFSWAEAAALCMPRPVGLTMTIDALTEFKGRELSKRIAALSWFRSAQVLEWIECNAPTATITGEWGQLASLSNLTWDKAEKWLSQGRPLSLVALDSLDQFLHLPRHAPLIRSLRPTLRGVPGRTTILRALETQKLNDSAPRVVKKCDFLIENIEKIHIAD